MNDEDQTDRRMLWIGAYLVALHAEASRPRQESYTLQHAPAPGHGGVAVMSGGTIARNENSDAEAARKAADLAVSSFDNFNKVEGK